MLPEQPISFPEFVADQLLTASNLNDLFHYLDVQERGTRADLIGIGIVCGLEVSVNSAGTAVTISRGCGITTQGYLVRWDDSTFENFKPYDAAKELVYPPFYGSGAQKFPIDELKSNSSEEGITKLTKAYLDDKVALLLVELLEIEAKNCDPESCDDKGKSITLTIRPLLVKKSAAVYLTGGVAGTNAFNQGWTSLPELQMPRHHVPAGDIFDSGDVFDGFQKVLSGTFLTGLEQKLSQAYTRLMPLVKDIYAGNPFTGLSANFAYVHDGTMSAQQLLYMQYYYDLFSDVINAYEELRKAGMKLLSICCPDEALFPRHLLLGVTGSAVSGARTDFRHYFIPSPAVCCHGDLVGELRVLFKRVVLLLQRFSLQTAREVPTFSTFNDAAVFNRVSNTSAPIRITPSSHGNVPLSEKAIPFYYNAAAGADKLYQHWNVARSRAGSAARILSYNAGDYNNSDDAVLQPLHYDLEPHNFLRIEGHVGHRYTDALAAINQIRDTARLPFDVVALSADIRTLRSQLATIAQSTNSAGLRDGLTGELTMQCHFQDLEALYDTMAQGLLCNLCKEMKYYYLIPYSFRDQTSTLKVPQAPLLKKCDPAFRYSSNTLGDVFEEFYKGLPANQYIERSQFFAATSFGKFSASGTQTNGDNSGTVLGIALLYYIEKLSEILTTTLISFNIAAFLHRYSDLMAVAQQVKAFHQAASVVSANAHNELNLAFSEDVIDHIDSLLYACRDAQFTALYNDYKTRWIYLSMLQKFGFYVKMHPGIQHKAGVTMGGTFILVYHESSAVKRGNLNIFTAEKAHEVAVAATPDVNVSIADRLQHVTGAAKQSAGNKPAADEEAPAAAAAQGAEAMTEEKATISQKTEISGTELNSAYTAPASLHRIDSAKLKSQISQKQFSVIDKLFYKELTIKHSLDELTAQLPDKIVIADFYLPYMCCSDCPPVYYIVNETKEETAQPTISMKTLQFCNDDKTSYPIAVTPAGGSFGNSEGVTQANGVFGFNPSAVSIPDDSLNKIVQLVYTKDGLSASVNVTVFAKPVADFEALPGTVFTLFIFNNKSTKAASVAWAFGDGLTGAGDHVAHNYAQSGPYVVTLTATNGTCIDTATKEIQVVKATVSIERTEFCSADTDGHNISVNLPNGAISGEGTFQGTDGPVFIPSKVAFTANQASKEIVISYSVNGQLAQTTVKVFRTPSAAFTVQPAATANIRTFRTSNSFPAQYSWDFGDGSASVEANPSHQFKDERTFPVTLHVTNGKCSATASQDVVIKTEQRTKTCGPLESIIATFKNLKKVNPELFSSFTELYKQYYPEVEDFFAKLGEMSGASTEEQIRFFKDSGIAALLEKWFTALNPLVISSEVRSLAIAMWRVLTDLAMYVMCIQDDDFDKNKIDLGDLFGSLVSFIKGWAAAVTKFTPADMAQLKLLLSDMTAERERVTTNGEAAVKKSYLIVLDACIALLTTYAK